MLGPIKSLRNLWAINRFHAWSTKSLQRKSTVVPRLLSMEDNVHIDKLQVDAVVGPDFWDRKDPQKCFVTIKMLTDFDKAAASDDLRYSLNYAAISKKVTSFVNTQNDWGSLGKVSRMTSNYLISKYQGIKSLRLSFQTKSAHVRCNDISAIVDTCNQDYDILKICNLQLLTLLGVFTFERLRKQFVTIELELPWPKDSLHSPPHKNIIDSVAEYVENCNFKTVESLAESVAKVVSLDEYFQQRPKLPITVKITKLNAITNTDGVGVSCQRTPKQLELFQLPGNPIQRRSTKEFDLPIYSDDIKTNTDNRWNKAFLAFGSNLGDRFQNIQLAIELLEKNPQITVNQVSSLFESEPMYFTNQDLFINGCIEIGTSLKPLELLEFCKEIEYKNLKRVKDMENGPRTIDLDIIMYLNADNEQVLLNDPKLTIPHLRMLERSFVLEPLCELVPFDLVHPLSCEPLTTHLSQIYSKGNLEDQLWKLIPLPTINGHNRFLKFKSIEKFDDFTGKTTIVSQSPSYMMCVLNTTPDSFSDGNEFYHILDKQLIRVQHMYEEGLKLHDSIIIDIGGCSTRPNSEQIEEEIELQRTIPLIKAIRSRKDWEQEKIIISIDTYRAQVAMKAIEAGVDMINDISGGTFDASMFDVVAKHPKVSYVLSHTRGDISNMVHMAKYDDDLLESGDDLTKEFMFYQRFPSKTGTNVIRSIAREVSDRYSLAMLKNVRRWQLIIDPGLGFAKNGKNNLQVIRHLSLLKNYSKFTKDDQYVNFRNLPILVGPSRKSFIGKITDEPDASKRDFATGSAVTSCIGFGADIIRIHDYTNCSKAIRMADAIYKGV